jgi:hypothetical protein
MIPKSGNRFSDKIMPKQNKIMPKQKEADLHALTGDSREKLVAKVELRNPACPRRRALGSSGRALRRLPHPAHAPSVLEFVVIALLAIAFAQTFPIDLAILFAGDTLMYLEIVVIIRLAAGRELILQMSRIAAQLARIAMRALRAAVSQPVSRINRLRERRTLAHPVKPRRASDRSDDGEGFGVAWGGLATA